MYEDEYEAIEGEPEVNAPPTDESVDFIEKLIEDEELKKLFGYSNKDLRLANLREHDVEWAQRALGYVYKLIAIRKYYGYNLVPAAEFIYAQIMGVAVPSRAIHGFERRMLVTTRKIAASEEPVGDDMEHKKFRLLRW